MEVSAKKKCTDEGCKLSFMWGNMRTAAWETVPQITEKLLQRGGGEGQYMRDFGERGIHVIEHICFAEGFH